MREQKESGGERRQLFRDELLGDQHVFPELLPEEVQRQIALALELMQIARRARAAGEQLALPETVISLPEPPTVYFT